MTITVTARKYWLATLAAAVIYGAMALIDTELIAHHLRAEARYLDYFVLSLVAFIFVLVLEDFHERESQRLREVQFLVADMNHHIRNALQVIMYANATQGGGQFTEQVSDSIERIDWALREVLGERAQRLGVQPPGTSSGVRSEWNSEKPQQEVRVQIANQKAPPHESAR